MSAPQVHTMFLKKHVLCFRDFYVGLIDFLPPMLFQTANLIAFTLVFVERVASLILGFILLNVFVE
jgi:hypothetical protein